MPFLINVGCEMCPGELTLPKRILVAEDERHIAKLIQVNLQREGHEVVIVSDGKQALELAEESSFDLIILDYVMPQMDGLETLRAIRANPVLSGIPVALLTTHATEMAQGEPLDPMPDRILGKPFNASDIRDLVER